jgi:hypothetical protein
MKILHATAFAFLMFGNLAAYASQPIINLSVGGEIRPGVYGQVQFTNAPPPVLYAKPVIIVPPSKAVVIEPLYLHVPPGHAKNWTKYCGKYDACGRPVYFVKSAEYEPGYRKHKGRHGIDERRDEGRRDEGRGYERRDEGRENEGHGRGYRGEGRD